MTEESSGFGSELFRLIEHVEGIRPTVPLLMKTVTEALQEAGDDFQIFLETKGVSSEVSGEIQHEIGPEDFPELNRLQSKLLRTALATNLIPRAFVVALVSQFDAFMGGLLRAIFHTRPDLLIASEKPLTFAQLSNFESIEDARNFVVDKEIDGFLRNSHAEQIHYLERKLDMTLTKGLKIWPIFIELTERRNLFVHANGVVNHQYLNACRQNGVKLDRKIETGNHLSASYEYFMAACDCIFEVATKLTHVIWRKLMPDDRPSADHDLNQITYDLVDRSNYTLAITLLNFATKTIKKFSSDEIRLYLLLNKAQALKWIGSEKECREILDMEDWSAKSPKYLIVRSALLDDFEEAGQIMKALGSNGELTKTDYKNWPVFKKFRETDTFLKAYSEVFGESYVVEPPEVTPSEEFFDVDEGTGN